MLLNNASKLNYSVDIDLTFDDDTRKTMTVKEGDTINITFRYNGVKLTKQGEVLAIYPSKIMESQLYGVKKMSAVLEIDASTEFKSCTYKVDIDDILDINANKVEPTEESDVLHDLDELLPQDPTDGDTSSNILHDLSDLDITKNNN